MSFAQKFRSRIRQAGAYVSDMIWPEKSLCLCCKKILRPSDILTGTDSEDMAICKECREELDRLVLIKEDRVTKTLFADALSVFVYDGPARDLVLGLKHGTVASAVAPLVRYAAEMLKKEAELPPDTVVTWVTMPDDRKTERCIDHGRILAEGIAKELGLPCRQLLVRSRGGHTQQGLNAEQRKKNVTGRFSAVKEEMPRSVLLVDDVLTTGSTLEECAKVLRAAGVKDAHAVTICKTRACGARPSRP